MTKLILSLTLLFSWNVSAKGYVCTKDELASSRLIHQTFTDFEKQSPDDSNQAATLKNVIFAGLKTLAKESVEALTDEGLKRNIYCGTVEKNSKNIADFFGL